MPTHAARLSRRRWPGGSGRLPLLAGLVAALGAALLVPGAPAAAGAAAPSDEGFEPWLSHATFEDFVAGRVEDGGTNLYVTRGGWLEMIHRWDLDNDGFLDILVVQDHDPVENVDALVYWGRPGGPQSLLPPLPERQPLDRLLREAAARERFVTRLPSDGGGRAIVADLDGDGYAEIVFCNFIHNYSVHTMGLVYWGDVDGYRADRRDELPTLLAGGVAAADFDGDGFVDLAFANHGTENGDRFGFDMHLESYVYWNGPAGFDVERRTSLATRTARDVAAGDVDGDGYPDALFVNNDTTHRSLSLYLGGADGFVAPAMTWPAGDVIGAELVDLTDDGHLDLVLAHADDRVTVHRGDGTVSDDGALAGPAWVELPSAGAADATVGDLDADGRPEIVLANPRGDVSYVYWADASGYAPSRRTELPTLAATDAHLADLDGDGDVDLAFANEHDAATTDVPAYVYWNRGGAFDAADRRDLQGFGAVALAGGDLDLDGHADLVVVNRNSGSHGPIDSLIYWGNPRHRYTPAAMTAVPGDGGLTTTADLDADGWMDLVFPGGSIFEGGPDGFRLDRDLEVPAAKGVSVADLDRDGHLDLVVVVGSRFGGGPSPAAWILWGDAEGHETSRRTELALGVQIGQAGRIADFDRDGHLDLLFTDVDTAHVDLFYGSDDGYGERRHVTMDVQPTSSPEVADLNADGWLDLIFGGGWDPERFGRPSRQTLLVWGGPDGFNPARADALESYLSLEQAVADLDRDGHLDIVMTNYHAYHTRTLPAFVYWGSAGGSYSASRRTSLPAESSSALSVADLNRDTWMDLVVFNHLDRGDHAVGSHIYWGGIDGYTAARRDWFPTFGAHFGRLRDVGNIYDRRLREAYVSAPLAWPLGRGGGRLRWVADTPHATGIELQVRSAVDAPGLERAPWRGPEGETGVFRQPGETFGMPDAHRWLQYRAVLTTPDAGSTPRLREVSVDVTTAAMPARQAAGGPQGTGPRQYLYTSTATRSGAAGSIRTGTRLPG